MDTSKLNEFYRLVETDPYLSNITVGIKAKEDIKKGDFEIAVARLLVEEQVVRRASKELAFFLDTSRLEPYKRGYRNRGQAIQRANTFTFSLNQQHRVKKHEDGLWYVYNVVDK